MFLDKLRDTRERRSTQTELGMFLAKVAKAKPRREAWDVAPLEECRAHWLKECGWKDHRWPEDEDDQQMANRDEEQAASDEVLF